MSTARTLAVPPSRHCPLSQPQGAAIVTGATAPTRAQRAALAVLESRAFAVALRAAHYDVAARALEARTDALEKAMGREPIEPADPRCRRLGGGA